MVHRPELRTLALALSLAIASLGLLACEEQGPMERAGEKVDEAVEEVQDEVDDAS